MRSSQVHLEYANRKWTSYNYFGLWSWMLCECQLSKGSTIEQQFQFWQFHFLACLFVDNEPARVVSVELTELAITAHNAVNSSMQLSMAQLCSCRPLITDRNQTTFDHSFHCFIQKNKNF